MKTLRRSSTNRVIGGVAGGIAEYFNLDPVLIRLAFVLMALFGAGVLFYIIAWIIMPEHGSNRDVQDAEIVS
jgi:phage shock protein PspC (stress-responsive transcriptional regulator)